MTQEDGQPETRHTEYTPPASRLVEQYCRRVCREMGEQFTEAEIMEGFTQFMKVAVKVKLRELNKGFDRVIAYESLIWDNGMKKVKLCPLS